MILSFKKQFREPILMGSKIHTIREDKNGRWKAGNKIHFATGIRTKNYECFEEGECISIQKIEIKHQHTFASITIDNTLLGEIYKDPIGVSLVDRYNVMEFIKNDGFHKLESFLSFFPTDFKGKIIHWTDFNY